MTASTSPAQRARSRLGIAAATGAPPEVIAARRDELVAAHVETAIRKALASAPPLSDAQCERLAALLRGA